MAGWRIEGQYMETCNCTYVCPCPTSNLTARPTEGDCKAAIALRIDKGQKDGVKLDGVSFIVVLRSPGPMADGTAPTLIASRTVGKGGYLEALVIQTGRPVMGFDQDEFPLLPSEVDSFSVRDVRFILVAHFDFLSLLLLGRCGSFTPRRANSPRLWPQPQAPASARR